MSVLLSYVKTRNVTLSLAEDLLRRVEIIAAEREISVSALLTQALRQIADEEHGYAEANRAMLKELTKGFTLGTHGKTLWTRDDMHGR